MICANLYIKVEKPTGDDVKRIDDAIELMKEIAHAIGKCSSDEEAYDPFLEMVNRLNDIKNDTYLY